MSTYVQIIDIWISDALKKQILFACMKTANYIVTTEPTETPNHANRVNWAKTVMFDPYEAAMKISTGVITNGDIQAGNPTDAQVQYVVDVLVDTFANL